MTVQKLKGSGGSLTADITEEQAKKADLGVGELFLAPVGRLDEQRISKYFCKNCNAEFDKAPKLEVENPNEELSPNMTLKEIGQYICHQCNSKIAEYREFLKKE